MVILIAQKKGPGALNATETTTALCKIVFLKVPKLPIFFKLHTSHWSLHTTYCTLRAALFTQHTTHCTLHTTHYTLHTAHCTLNTVDTLPGGERDTEWVQQPGGKSGQ